MGKLESFIGFEEGNDNVLHLAKVLFVLLPFASVVFTLSTTFYMIFIAEAIGGGDYIQGLGIVGMLVVVQMIVQTVLDYPSGALGDWIGQRYVIAMGNTAWGIGFFMVSFVDSTTPFAYLVAIYVLQGFGASQISGAWGAWFDNNYRYANPEDTERKQYGVFWGRVGMIGQIAATLSLIPGGILATLFGRPWVFQIEAVGAIIFAMMVLRLIRDFPEVEEMREERPTMGEYIDLLKSGVSFLYKTPYVKYIVIGSMLAVSTISVWGNLILFPLYFSYLLTDVAVASYRTILFVPGVISEERSGVWSQRFEPRKWIPRFRILQACGFFFYLILSIMMYVFPPASNGGDFVRIMVPLTEIELLQIPVGNIIPIIVLFFLFSTTLIFGGFAEILTQRILLDVIPNRIRNSVYSLSPTIMILFAMPQIAVFGWLIPIAGFPATLATIGTISLIGVLIIRHGLDQPRPAVPLEEKEPDATSEATIEVSD
ncbi:MAG: MFS transporter [Candidatus Thorarchaeota archaeon]|nr:MAG: MFS transporter [Candidatus Thorarchaeota archaeon]